jgi:hypothetical protein
MVTLINLGPRTVSASSGINIRQAGHIELRNC